jgi:sugar phosphate permease
VEVEPMTNEQKVTWLTSFSHFITHGYMTLLPAVLVVIAGEHSLSFTDIGIIANIGYFLYGLGSFPSGYLADRFGSKRILTVGVFGMAVSSILVGISPGAAGFAVAYTLLGTFASIHHPAGLSFIARRVMTTRGRALGFHGVLGNVGLFLTPMAAAFSVMLFGTWRAAYIIFGIIGLGFAVILQVARIEEEPDLSWQNLLFRSAKRSGLKEKEKPSVSKDLTEAEAPENLETSMMSILPVALLVLYLGSILSGFIFRGSLTFFPVLLQQEVHFITSHDEPVVMAGFFTTGILSLGLIGSWFGGYLNDKITKPEWFPVVIFVIVTPCLYFISRLTDSGLLAVGCLFSLVYYAWQPSHNFLIAKYTRKASHGMGFGVNFFLIFGIGSIATAIGGYVADDYGVDRFYWIMSIIGFCAMLVALGVIAVKRYQIRFNWKVVKEEG